MGQTKKCSECGQEKPLGEFNKNRNNKDGYQGRCRECFSRYNKARYWSDPSRFKKSVAEYRKANLENVFETRMAMCERNPCEKNAREAVNIAVELGYIDKPDHCMGCGRKASETRISGHHYDYSKPLEVIWVCARCHRPLDAARRINEGKAPYGRARSVVMLVGGKSACRFDTIAEAARAVGVKPQTLTSHLTGKSKTCAGFEWRYENA